MKNAAALIALLLATLLTGCAGPRSLVPGQSTEADVLSRLGAPKDTRTEPNGDLVWEYPTGPEGFFNYAVRLGPHKRKKAITQIVSEEQLYKSVIRKTDRAEVQRLLGRPAKEERLYIGESWYWRHLKGGTQPGYLVVTFDPQGIATTKISILDIPGGRLGM